LLEIATTVAARVPCVRMRFPKDETFWERLDILLP